MSKREKAKTSMPVKVNKTFRSPLTNRMVEVGHTMHVPQNRFWFRRVQDGDVEPIKTLRKKAVKSGDKDQSAKKEKGSK